MRVTGENEREGEKEREREGERGRERERGREGETERSKVDQTNLNPRRAAKSTGLDCAIGPEIF